jgi:selenophosphate synthase
VGATVGGVGLAGDEPEVLEQAELSTQGAFVDAEVLAEVRSPGTAQVVQLARSA